MKPSGIGGQAVIEGVMMKNKDQYAIAVRKPDNEIIVEKSNYISKAEKYKIFKLPIFRGMLAFAESMIIGTKTLTFSASFYEEEEEVKPSKIEKAFTGVFKEKAESVATGITMFFSMILAVGIFIILPRFIANLLAEQITSEVVSTIMEGCIRILIFIAYVVAISQIKDIKRMFMYHGAEHKTINCLEQGFELTVENVKWQSKQHKRCGTSFMFIVMFVSIIFFIFIRVDQEWLRYLIRILLIPIIAGVSYEFIRLAGRSDSKIVNILSQPGMWMQGLTTKEPDDDMIEVAIQSVDAVFDWREFLNQNDDKAKKNSNQGKKYSNKNSNDKNSNNKNTSIKNTNIKGGNDNKSNDNRSNDNKNGNKNNNDKNSNSKNSNDKNSNDAISNNRSSNINNKNNSKNNNNNNNKNRNINNYKISQDQNIAKVNSDKGVTDSIDEETDSTSVARVEAANKRQSNKDYKKATKESAVTVEKTVGNKATTIFDEEEDDEILRALDRFLINNEESTDKE